MFDSVSVGRQSPPEADVGPFFPLNILVLVKVLNIILKIADLLDVKLLPLSAPQALAEAFLDHLWKILQSPSQPAVARQAAAGYLGSFLARAKFVPLP